MPHMRAATLIALCLTLVGPACAVETEAPPIVGDVGDNSGQELKTQCNLSRDSILASVQGGRRTAIERGFSWYDAQVPYSQSQYHEGYRTDCSGFVSMCWELGTSYTTANFIDDTSEWTSLGSFDDLVPADAMVYRSGKAGHIMMFVGWNDAAKTEACVLEQASTADDMQFRARSVDSLAAGGYHAIRAAKLSGSAPAGKTDAPQCHCDAQCAQNGDCCSDCPPSGGSGGASGSGSGGSAGSGGGGGQCYCDASCSYYGDCCADCGGSGGASGGGSGGASGGGSGGSAGSGGQCYCDVWCVFYGDCCADCS